MSTKSERTHKRILECGMALIFSTRYDEITVPQICSVSGVSRPTFYQHFSSKEQLMAEYFESENMFDEDTQKWMDKAPDAWTAIIRMQMVYISQMCDESHREAVANYMSYKLKSNGQDALLQFNESLENMLTELIRKAQAEGTVSNSSDPYRLSKSVFMLHMGNIFTWCAGDDSGDPYSGFFWGLEAVLGVDDMYRSLWKLEENRGFVRGK